MAATYLDGTAYTSSRTYTAQGTTGFTYYSVDNAGNTEALKSNSFKIDSVAPSSKATLTGTVGLNDWYVSPVQITLSGSDATSGLAQLILDETFYTGPRTYTAQGTTNFTYRAWDNAGNLQAPQAGSFQIDSIAPNTGVTLNGSLGKNGWYTSTVAVSLSADDATSGVASMVLDGSAYAGPRTYATQGFTDLTYFSTDNAGNVEPTYAVVFKLDNVAPSSSASLSGTMGTNGWYISPVTITLSASDATSGVDMVTLDDAIYLGPTIISTEGQTSHSFFATDKAGNAEALQTLAVKVDTVAPTTVATLSGTPGQNGWYVSDVSVTLAGSDATSGVARTYLDDVDYTMPLLVSGEGEHLNTYYSVDNAGNRETPQAIAFKIDKTPPAIVSFDKEKLDDGRLIFHVEATDNLSGVAGGVVLIFRNGELFQWLNFNSSQATLEWAFPDDATWLDRFTFGVIVNDNAGLSGDVGSEGVSLPTTTPFLTETPISTWLPKPTRTPTSTGQVPQPTQTRQFQITATTQPQPTSTLVPLVAVVPISHALPIRPVWPFFLILGLDFSALSASAALDPRPKVILRMSAISRDYLMKLQKEKRS